MKEDLRFKIDWLKWIVDFCNTDLKSIRGAEKHHLYSKLETFVDLKLKFGKTIFNRDDYHSVSIPPILEAFSKEIQDWCLIFLNHCAQQSYEAWENIKEDEMLGFIQVRDYHPSLIFLKDRCLMDFTLNIGEVEVKTDEEVDILRTRKILPFLKKIQLKRLREEIEKLETQSAPNRKTETQIRSRLSEIKMEVGKMMKNDWFPSKREVDKITLGRPDLLSNISTCLYQLNLIYLLDNMPMKWIQKCKGCERFFLNPTKHEKMYCNFSCASRSIAHSRYEDLKKDPKKYEAHLKKHRKYSMNRYDRMRKDELGPNVRIRRRVRVLQKQGPTEKFPIGPL